MKSMSFDLRTVPLRQGEDGAIRIGDTRVLLELVIELFLEGHSPESICSRIRA